MHLSPAAKDSASRLLDQPIPGAGSGEDTSSEFEGNGSLSRVGEWGVDQLSVGTRGLSSSNHLRTKIRPLKGSLLLVSSGVLALRTTKRPLRIHVGP